MRTKFLLLIPAFILITALFLGIMGVALADPDLGTDGASASRPRLIGVVITGDHLDLYDFEAALEDHINRRGLPKDGEFIDTSEYAQRLYATLTEVPLTNAETGEITTTQEYIFEGIEGIRFFAPTIADEEGTYFATHTDPGISDGHSHFKSTDNGDSVTLEGTVYLTPGFADSVIYINPVYQDESGVYLEPGSGFSASGAMTEGEIYSQNMKEESKTALNGETVEEELNSVTVSINLMFPIEKTVITCFGGDHSVISSTEYTPEDIVSPIVPGGGCAYIIVEHHKTAPDGSSTVAMEMYDKNDPSLTVYSALDNGIIESKQISIEW